MGRRARLALALAMVLAGSDHSQAVHYVDGAGDGECVCYDASSSQAAGPAFGGGEVMACDKPLGRITAQLALGIDLICGREPYPAYSHICCDTCSKQGCELAKEGEAWSDAMRYPAEYAAFTGREPPSAPDEPASSSVSPTSTPQEATSSASNAPPLAPSSPSSSTPEVKASSASSVQAIAPALAETPEESKEAAPSPTASKTSKPSSPASEQATPSETAGETASESPSSSPSSASASTPSSPSSTSSAAPSSSSSTSIDSTPSGSAPSETLPPLPDKSTVESSAEISTASGSEQSLAAAADGEDSTVVMPEAIVSGSVTWGPDGKITTGTGAAPTSSKPAWDLDVSAASLRFRLRTERVSGSFGLLGCTVPLLLVFL